MLPSNMIAKQGQFLSLPPPSLLPPPPWLFAPLSPHTHISLDGIMCTYSYLMVCHGRVATPDGGINGTFFSVYTNCCDLLLSLIFLSLTHSQCLSFQYHLVTQRPRDFTDQRASVPRHIDQKAIDQKGTRRVILYRALVAGRHFTCTSF